MVDIVSPEVRSRMMSGIRGKDTQPEMRVRRFLHGRGFRFRLHDRNLPGVPDLVFPRYRAVVFVHGCYWHRHAGCSYAAMPASNIKFWKQKFDKTVARDRKVVESLLKEKWKVIVVWECGLRRAQSEKQMNWIEDSIRSGGSLFMEWPRVRKRHFT